MRPLTFLEGVLVSIFNWVAMMTDMVKSLTASFSLYSSLFFWLTATPLSLKLVCRGCV